MGALLVALASATAYGTSDFLGGLASRRVDVLRVLVLSYPVSAVLMTIAALPVGGAPSPADLAWGAAAGLVMATAAWSFYLALATGPISIVSPITGLLSAAVPVMVGLALGEHIDTPTLLGIGVALVAVVLVSLVPHADTHATHPFTRTVAMLTILSGLAWAFSYVFTDRISESAGLWALVAARWSATLGVWGVAAARRSLRPPTGAAAGQAAAIGTLDAVAHLTMMLALHGGQLSVGSVVISMFPAVTIVCAVTVLGERLSRVQAAGLALGALGVVLIGL